MHFENELLHKNKTEYKQNETDIARTSNVWHAPLFCTIEW